MGNLLRGLIAYLITSFGLAFAIDALGFLKALETKNDVLVLLLGVARMYAPFVGAVAAAIAMGIGVGSALREWGLRLGKARWIPLGITLPYAFYSVAIPIALLAGITVTNPIYSIPKLEYMAEKIGSGSLVLAIALINTVIAGSTINTIAALGEEMGWRGFLLTTLSKRIGLYGAAIVVGIVWSLWHAPLILIAGFNYPHHPDALGLATFTGLCIALSVALSILRAKSGSVLPPAFLHGNLNALGGLALLTFVGDEIITFPVGLLGIASVAIIATVLAIATRCRSLKQ